MTPRPAQRASLISSGTQVPIPLGSTFPCEIRGVSHSGAESEISKLPKAGEHHCRDQLR
jgi:hypothetical protein